MAQMTPAEFTALREKIGTQDEAATEMDTNRRTIGRWERGERSIPGVAAVCVRMLAERAQARRAATFEAARAMSKGGAE